MFACYFFLCESPRVQQPAADGRNEQHILTKWIIFVVAWPKRGSVEKRQRGFATVSMPVLSFNAFLTLPPKMDRHRQNPDVATKAHSRRSTQPSTPAARCAMLGVFHKLLDRCVHTTCPTLEALIVSVAQCAANQPRSTRVRPLAGTSLSRQDRKRSACRCKPTVDIRYFCSGR